METKRGKEYEYRKTQMEEMSKETREVKEKKGRDNWKLATWNVRGIKGREDELIQELERYEIKILTVTETKKKGIGEQVMRGDHLMIYGGVKYEQHGAAGVGCIIDKNWRKYVEHWQVCSERLLKVRLRREKSELWNIIVAYGPNEDAKVEDKNKFWEELNMVTEECRGKIVVCGDFNSRVGIGGGRDGIVGKYGETKKTNNGERLIEYCRMNNMIVSNTFFEHKDVHRYTRHGHNVDDRSIIDYFLVERDNRRDIADVRVHRGAEIGSDHYMLVAKIMSEGKEKVEHRQLNEGYENIKSYKLREMSVAEEYRKDVEENMTRVEIGVEEGVEEVWGRFKNILMESAKRVCGSVKIGRNRRGTAWWSDNLKRQIKMKKILWKEYLKNRNACNYRKYKEQRKRVKQVTLEEKEKTWRDFGERMEKNYTENRKLFYRVMKNMRKGEKVDNTSIKCKRNRLLVGEKEIMERWKEHFIELLKGNEVKKVDTQKKDKRWEDEGEDLISIEEVKVALRRVKNGKAAGYDRITPEMMKNMGEKGINVFREICQKAWNSKEIPQDWKMAMIVPAYKNGDRKKCDNYRGINLLCTALKVYEAILESRLKISTEDTLDKAQSGFMRGRSVQDHIFTLKQTIHKMKRSGRKAYFVFIDLVKAFDRVSRSKMWDILKTRGINRNLVESIKSVYCESLNCVIVRNMKSELFETKEGLRQGGVLSPTLFILFLDEIIREAKERTEKLTIGFKNLRRVVISECAFADDIVLMAGTRRSIQGNLDIWNGILRKYGMEINRRKTKVMEVNDEREDDWRLEIEGEEVEKVKCFRYLGVNIENTGSQEREINERIEKAGRLYHTINRKFLRRTEVEEKTKMTVFKSIFRPVLSYGCETWNTTRRMRSKLQAVEMKFLRGVKGVTRMDRRRNDDIRGELGIKSLERFVGERQLGWWGHLHRMEEERPIKQIWEAKVEKKAKRGRPQQTWEDMVEEEIKKRGKSVREAEMMTSNRTEWKKFIESN